jgi:DNA-binding beta-propeller fold protein YncE
MEEVEEKIRKKLEVHISKIQAQAEGVSSSLEKIWNADMDIHHCEAECQLEIDRAFELLIDEIKERKQVIKASTAEQCRLQSSGYTKQKEELKAAQAELQESITLATTSLKDPVVEFLSSQESIVKKLDHVESKLQKLPLSVSRPQLLMVKVSDMQWQLEKYVTVQQQMDPKQWDLEKSFLKSVPLAQPYTFNIVTRAERRFWKKGFQEKNYKFNVALRCIRDGSEIKGDMKQLSADRVTVFITPLSRGHHKLSVTLSGVHISNSPLDVFVYNPHPVREIPNLRGAIGLTLIDNKLIATEMDCNQILYVDSGFCIVLDGVNGITQDSEINLYATTGASAPHLHKFTREGIHIKSGGEHGAVGGQFLYSNGPRISKNNELYVCDSSASRVQVFDLDLNFKRAFGKGEKGKDSLNFPADIDFDTAGNVYVTDPLNNRIQVFDSRGHYIRSIGTSHLKTPAGLFIRDELIYTTEYLASRISVLTISGELVTTIGISKPTGITVGEDGFVYATSNQSKVVVF